MSNISKNCSYNEAVRSDSAKRLGLSNTPNDEQLAAMKAVAEAVFEPLREHFGVPIYISSFFRSAEVNKAVKGSKTSAHCLGEAMDLDADMFGGVTNKQLFDYIKDNLEYRELIWEAGDDNNPDWVHVQFSTVKPNIKQVLKMKKVGKLKTYEILN